MTSADAPKGELLLYQTNDGRTRIECRFEGNTLWLTQAQMAALFETTPQNITLHLSDIYATHELEQVATCKSYLHVRTEGTREVQRSTLHYSLPAVLAVGFRVRSHRGTQFRRWAIRLLEEKLDSFLELADKDVRTNAGKIGHELAVERASAPMSAFTESVVEQAALAWFEALGYAIAKGPSIAPGEPGQERSTYADVVLDGRLRDANTVLQQAELLSDFWTKATA